MLTGDEKLSVEMTYSEMFNVVSILLVHLESASNRVPFDYVERRLSLAQRLNGILRNAGYDYFEDAKFAGVKSRYAKNKLMSE